MKKYANVYDWILLTWTIMKTVLQTLNLDKIENMYFYTLLKKS